MIEIERKFLVTSQAFKKEAISEKRIVQGFLNTHVERTVRVRIKDNKGVLTVKGKTSDSGTTRFEWETELPLDQAQELLKLCEKGIVDKLRYEIPFKNHIFEVDVFFGDNEGLILAEVELKTEDEAFEKPDWLGKEVTGNSKYYNSQLSKNPFKKW